MLMWDALQLMIRASAQDPSPLTPGNDAENVLRVSCAWYSEYVFIMYNGVTNVLEVSEPIWCD